jgi:adenosylhomocysteine nucleosidase
MPVNENGGIIALAAALPVELVGIKKLGRFYKKNLGDIGYLRGDIHGVDVALFVSGVGEARAYETAKRACASLSLAAYISLGLSAALRPGLRPGDVVVGVSATSLASKGGQVYISDATLLKLAADALKEVRKVSFGPLLVTPKVAVTSAEKKGLAQASSFAALDMESAGAAKAAQEAGVPFIAIRAISDTLDEDLPVDFNRFMKEGGMDWPRFMAYVITHPGVIPGLMRLGRNSRLAATNLAAAVDRFMLTETRAKAISMLEDYLEGRISREVVHKWALDFVISKEWDELITKDKLLSDVIHALFDLHHEGDEEEFNPSRAELEHYRNRLQGKKAEGAMP